MAHFYKLSSGLWRAQIELRGVRASKTFGTKTAAQMWAQREELKIRDGLADKWPRKTLDDAMRKYEEEVSPSKKSLAAERSIFGQIRRDFPQLAGKKMSSITAVDLSAWRDARQQVVGNSSVRRHANIMSVVWKKAAEWGWVPDVSPWRKVKLPPMNAPRDRLITWREARAILRALGYRTGVKPQSGRQEAAWAFLVALRTGMRQSEITSLKSEDVVDRVATVREHKTKHLTGKARKVPLTRQGARLLHQLKPEMILTSSEMVQRFFIQAKRELGLDDIHFHDSRATALTHLARKVDVMTLARISGHSDLRTLMNTYYRETEESIAARL